MERNSSLIRSRSTFLKDNPITHCNLVIVCYNTPIHTVNNTEITRLPNSRFYKACYPFLVFPRFPLFLVALLIPLINLLQIALLIVLWVKYERALRVYHKNIREVPNVFEKMVYSPAQCHRHRRSNMFVSIHVDQFSRQHLPVLAERMSQDHVQVMFYSDQFKKWYERFPCYRWLHVTLIFFSVLLVAACYLMCYPRLLMNCDGMSLFDCELQ